METNNGVLQYPLVIKHGVLEHPFIEDVPSYKLAFTSGISQLAMFFLTPEGISHDPSPSNQL